MVTIDETLVMTELILSLPLGHVTQLNFILSLKFTQSISLHTQNLKKKTNQKTHERIKKMNLIYKRMYTKNVFFVFQ